MNGQPFTAKYRHLMLLLALWIVGTIVYVPGLHGPFVFDDQNNITYNLDVAIDQLDLTSLRTAALSNQSGMFKRPIAALTFGLNHYAGGGFANTFPFKITNLVIHLFNATLIYWLSYLLLGGARVTTDQTRWHWHIWLPAAIAAAWALHPLQLTSVLYVVQRMTSLSALFVLSGLIGFIYGRLRLERGERYAYTLMTVGLLGGLVLGMLSKENAVLLPLFAIVVELIFFRGLDRNSRLRSNLAVYYGLLVLLPCLVALVWVIVNPDFLLRPYNARAFTLTERLLTEPRVLWFYVSLIFVPRSHAFGLYHDDIPISLGLIEPWTTPFAVLGLATSVFAAIIGRHRYPLLSFAILWFVVGHSIESGIIGLEIAHEHRNYLPSFGIIFGAVYGAALGMERLHRARLAVPLLFAYISVSAFVTFVRADTWATEESIIEIAVRNHPSSARAHYMLGEVYAKKRADPLKALHHYRKAADLEPANIAALVNMALVASQSTVPLGPDAEGLIQARSENIADAKPPVRVLGLPEFASIAYVGQRATLVLDDSVYAELERRLTDEPVSAMTGHALGTLTFCITRNERSCAHLYGKSVDWYRLAISNRHADNVARAYLAHGLAKLYLENGDLESARQMAVESQHYDPTNPSHPLLEARVHLALGSIDKAEAIIQRIQKLHAPLARDIRQELDTLLKQLRIQQSNT